MNADYERIRDESETKTRIPGELGAGCEPKDSETSPQATNTN